MTAIHTDLTKPARRAIAATWAFGAAYVALGGAYLYQARVIQQFLDGTVGVSALEQSDRLMAIVTLSLVAVILVAYLINGRFLFLASRNAQAASYDPNAITPGWAVGWYFVPIANFFMPYRAMKQTWTRLRHSDGIVPDWINVWWFSWVGLTLADSLIEAIGDGTTLEGLHALSYTYAVTCFLWLVPTFLFLRIVRTLGETSYDPSAVFA